MSMLNQLFNRGLLGAKCKTCLTLAISRIKLLQNKRDAQLKLMRKEIAEFLQAGQEAIARIRVEHVIREQNTWEAYEILELFCEFVLARVPILESQRDCPTELREAVASIIFSAPRCSDLPDLLHVRNLFAAKYGKEFIAADLSFALIPASIVQLIDLGPIIEKLSVSAPHADVKLKVLKAIAVEYNINWNSTDTEIEFSKKPEDLLNGPKPIGAQPQTQSRPQVRKDSSATAHSSASLNGNRNKLQSPASHHTTSSVHPNRIESSTTVRNAESKVEIKNASSESSDVLARARAAITAAERASAAARAAADLVNARFPSFKLE